jgi:hypothetical protein
MGVGDRQQAILEARRTALLEKRARRKEVNGEDA